MNWQYAEPEHISSILTYLVCKQSLTQANISCRDKFSVVTDVLYTLTAILFYFVFDTLTGLLMHWVTGYFFFPPVWTLLFCDFCRVSTVLTVPC